MRPIPTQAPHAVTHVDELRTTFNTTNDVQLGGVWFIPAGAGVAPSTVTVIVCGAGVPAKFYTRLARYLSEHGAAVLTFDYHGIGASLQGSVRKIRSGMDAWALYDISAALREARARYPNLPLTAVAHSVGTLLIGAATGADQLSRVVFIGAHTGHWRDYQRKWRLPMFFVWHVLMPLITRSVGYFPGRALRLGEDLPPQVAMDWAARRQPQLIRTANDERRFGPSMFRYFEFRVPTLSLSVSDDAFAPPKAARALLAMYPNLRAVQRTITPAEAGCPRLGHFGFLRSSARTVIWPDIAAWLAGEHA